jgi:hypothetical protein
MVSGHSNSTGAPVSSFTLNFMARSLHAGPG